MDGCRPAGAARRGWSKVPGIGPKAGEYWNELAADSSKLLAAARQLIEPVSGWLLVGGLALGRGLLELALSILIAFFLFRTAQVAAKRSDHRG